MTPEGVVECRASPANVRPQVVLGLEVRTAGRQEEKKAVPKDSKHNMRDVSCSSSRRKHGPQRGELLKSQKSRKDWNRENTEEQDGGQRRPSPDTLLGARLEVPCHC